MTQLETLVQHYVAMAALDKHYAWHRAKTLARECPGLYAELPALLTAAMQQTDSKPL